MEKLLRNKFILGRNNSTYAHFLFLFDLMINLFAFYFIMITILSNKKLSKSTIKYDINITGVVLSNCLWKPAFLFVDISIVCSNTQANSCRKDNAEIQ